MIVVLTHQDGTVDTLTDIELIRFDNEPALAIAHTEAEAIAHHLVTTWLGRELTELEANAVQNAQQTDIENILAAFHSLLEAADLADKTAD